MGTYLGQLGHGGRAELRRRRRPRSHGCARARALHAFGRESSAGRPSCIVHDMVRSKPLRSPGWWTLRLSQRVCFFSARACLALADLSGVENTLSIASALARSTRGRVVPIGQSRRLPYAHWLCVSLIWVGRVQLPNGAATALSTNGAVGLSQIRV